MFLIILQFITLVLSSSYLLSIINRLKKGAFNSIHIVYMGFYFFMIFPVLLDLIFGRPDYSNYSNFNNFIGFELSHNDPTTEIIYSIFLLFSSSFMFFFGKYKMIYKNQLKLNDYGILNKIVVFILTAIMCLPLILTLFRTIQLNQPILNLFNYDYLRLLFRGSIYFLYYYYLATFSVMSFIGILLLSNKNFLKLSILSALPIYIAIGIHGKRNIIAILIFLYLFSILFKSRIRTKNFKYLIAGFVLLILLVSINYQSEIRGIDFRDSISTFYTDFRVDYGRDDVIKMAIYNQINGNGILEGHANTHLYFLNFFFSDVKYIASPYKYSVYATSRLLGYDSPIDLGWGMTTGVFDESISNYGIILGTIISNFFIIFICRIGDRTKNGLGLILTYITAFFFMILQFTSFIFIFFIWFLVIFHDYFKRIKMRKKSRISHSSIGELKQ